MPETLDYSEAPRGGWKWSRALRLAGVIVVGVFVIYLAIFLLRLWVVL